MWIILPWHELVQSSESVENWFEIWNEGMLLWYIKYGGNQLCIPWYQILPPTIRVYMSLSVDTPPRSTSRSSEVFSVKWYYLNVKQINTLIFEVQVNRHILFTITRLTQMVFSVSKCWYKLRLAILEIANPRHQTPQGRSVAKPGTPL